MTKEIAVFGGGCFWHIQFVFSKVPGVVSTFAGYMGGDEKKYPNVTYEQVCSHQTGYAEVVLIEFDNKKVSYDAILEKFWKEHDPTTLNRQGPDIGDNYRSVIFYQNKEQKAKAEASKKKAQKMFEDKIVTEIQPAKSTKFVEAEDYHQNYVIKHGGVDTCPVL
ncbi:MAG TPA: peptide-methionine (S)-S-oxide reductase MsrA [Candidatus Nanoarchaeia archaeon]|nr:peptide-methionine (S)-S-oxide reductase MsrA [Candidatus Nanoarchaeia archaeon]